MSVRIWATYTAGWCMQGQRTRIFHRRRHPTLKKFANFKSAQELRIPNNVFMRTLNNVRGHDSMNFAVHGAAILCISGCLCAFVDIYDLMSNLYMQQTGTIKPLDDCRLSTVDIAFICTVQCTVFQLEISPNSN